MITATVAATWYGGGIMMGTAEWAFGSGISNVWSWELTAVSVLLVGIFLSKHIRNLEVVTLPEVLKLRFDIKNQVMLAIINIIILFAFVGMQILAIGTITQMLVPGISENVGLLIGLAVIFFYTFLGGQLSVALTDFIQFVLLAFGTILGAVFSVKAAGGIHHLVTSLPPSFVSPSGVGAAVILGWALSYLPASIIEQEIWRKVNSAKSARAAQKGTIFAGLILIALIFLTPFAGLAAKLVAPNIQAVQSLPYMAMNMMPIGIGIIVMLGAFAAVMSNASGYLIDGAAMITMDLVSELTHKSRESLVGLSKVMIIVMGLFAVLFAKMLPSIMGLASLAYALYAPVCFIPLVLGLFWKRISSNASFYSMLVVLIVEIVLYVAGKPFGNPALIGFPLSIVLTVVLSYMFPPDNSEKQKTFYEKMGKSKSKAGMAVLMVIAPLSLFRQASLQK